MLNVLTHVIATLGVIPAALLLVFSARGRKNILQRFGMWGSLPREFVWIHAASAGEIGGVEPLAQGIREMSKLPILTTVTSSTACERAAKFSDFVRMLPFDAWPCLWLALGGVQPRVCLVSERELWPSLFRFLKARGVAIVKINAMISEQSVRTIQKYPWLFDEALRGVTKVLAVDDLSAERFRVIGVPRSSVSVVGNVKYARKPLEGIQKSLVPMVVIGNIRPGEEEIVFPALKACYDRGASFRAAVVPRHQEKYSYFERSLQEWGLPFAVVTDSSITSTNEGPGIVLYKTFGVLEQLYAQSSLAIIGGTLQEYGGHNPLEPAPYHVCVAIGPYTSSIGTLRDELVNAGAVKEVATARDIEELLEAFLRNDPTVDEYAKQLRSFYAGNREALPRTLKELESFLR